MTGPSPFYRQHFTVEAPAIDERTFRPFFRIRTGLDQLHDDATISETEWRAARAFGDLALLAIATDWPTKWFGFDQSEKTRFGADVGIAGRIDARKRLRAIRRSLGRDDFALLEVHVVYDLTWTEIGRRLGVHPKTAKRRTIAAIKALTAVIWGVT